MFVTVRHEVAGPSGAAIDEEQDIVYRGAEGEAVKPGQPAAPIDAVAARQVLPDPVLLFRYSALTGNGHRIHYDADYVRDVEGYPGLIVHGPLQATWMAALAAGWPRCTASLPRPPPCLRRRTVAGRGVAGRRGLHLRTRDARWRRLHDRRSRDRRTELAFLTEPVPARGALLPVLPGISRIVADNPGRMTYHGTNTYLIEDADGVTVLDPGPDQPEHVADILRLSPGPIVRILLSHTHRDHLGATAALQAQTGAPTLGWQHSAEALHPGRADRTMAMPSRGWRRCSRRATPRTICASPGRMACCSAPTT